jgi:hypothetical protein
MKGLINFSINMVLLSILIFIGYEAIGWRYLSLDLMSKGTMLLWFFYCLSQIIRLVYHKKIKRLDEKTNPLHKIMVVSIIVLIAIAGTQLTILSVKSQLLSIVQTVQIPVDGKITYFQEGLAAGNINGKWGFINQNGEWVIPPQYEYAMNFQDGLACVKENGRYGYINKEGKMSIDAIYIDAVSFSDGLASVFDGDMWFIIETSGMARENFDYSHLDTSHPIIFHEGYSLVSKSNLYGYVDKKGVLAIPAIYYYARDMSDGFAAVKTESEEFYIRRDGSRAFQDVHFTSCEPFREGLALVTLQNDQEAVIHTDGTVAFEVPENVAGYSVFSEGLSVYCSLDRKRKYGYVNKSGEIVIPAILDSAGHFSGGLAKVNYCGIDVWIRNP